MSKIKILFYEVRKILCSDLYNRLDLYNEQLINLRKDLTEKNTELHILKDTLETKKGVTKELYECKLLIKQLEDKIDELNSSQYHELELYWNNKRKKSETVRWRARPLFEVAQNNTINWWEDNIQVDPRIFWTYDNTIPTFKGFSNDDIAIKCLDWVARNITYTADINPDEFWQFAFETFARRKGDCEDGAILIANMMLMSGVPYWRIRLNAGSVQGGGHAYVTYLAEKDNKWYILDWCYWYHESRNLGRTFKDAEKYFGIWFSFNTKYVYPDEKFERGITNVKT